MKAIAPFRGLLLLPFLLAFTSLNAQVPKAPKLASIIQNSRLDSVSRIERLAAMKFHQKINAYRVSSNVDTLAWNDTLWLASLNHCKWMEANNLLSHGEQQGSPMFSGTGPGERYSYVAGENGRCSWSGENALYNWSCAGSTIDRIAENIAQNSLVQWQNSPGHNRNMLAKGSKVHGVAFLIGKNNKVWSTDLFAYPYYNLRPNTTVIVKADPPAQTNSINPQKKNDAPSTSQSRFVKLDLAKTSSDVLAALYEKSGSDARRNGAMERAAMSHAQYVASTKKISHDERKGRRYYTGTTLRKRMMKASRGRNLLERRKWEFTESIAMVEADAAALDIGSLVNEIVTRLNAENECSNPAQVGYGLIIKRVKNKLTIYVVRVGAERKNK